MLEKMIAPVQEKRWQLVSETAGYIETLWDFGFRQNKQGSRNDKKLSGSACKSDQNDSLLMTRFFSIIKLS